MRKLEAKDLRSMGLFKHYRLVRKWASKTYGLNDADLELLIYFDCIGHFTKQDYSNGTLAYCWDKHRWDRLLKEGWIVVWREHNRTTQKYNIYKTSMNCSMLILRIYRILLGEEDLPLSQRRNKMVSGKTYTDKVMTSAMKKFNEDKSRWNGL
jgi:hypothetical protein